LSVAPERKGFVGKIGDSTGVINFFFFNNEETPLTEGAFVKLLEGKCKVYDEHPYVSVAGGQLKIAET
jgi:hypothetical protein